MDLKYWQKKQVDCEFNIPNSKVSPTFGECSRLKTRCNFKDCPNPFVSCGDSKKSIGGCSNLGVNALTVQETRALRYRNKEGLTYQEIANKMEFKKPRAWKLVQNALKKIGKIPEKGVNKTKKTKLRGLTEVQEKGLTKSRHNTELHKDSISISCFANLDVVEGKLTPLKNTNYRFIKSKETVLKIFKETLVIQFRKPIIKETPDECYNAATKRIENFINSFNMKGVFLSRDTKQLERHYAIIGTELAKKCVEEGEKLFIYEPKTGKLALMVDFSDKDKRGGMPHFETPHVEKGKSFIETHKDFIEDLTFKPHYLASETKYILDEILSSNKDFAINMKTHVEVMKKISDNLKEDSIVKKETLKTLKAIQEAVKK